MASNDPNVGTKTISFRLSDELAAMVDAVAKDQRRPTSQLCRDSLVEYFVVRGYLKTTEGEATDG